MTEKLRQPLLVIAIVLGYCVPVRADEPSVPELLPLRIVACGDAFAGSAVPSGAPKEFFAELGDPQTSSDGVVAFRGRSKGVKGKEADSALWVIEQGQLRRAVDLKDPRLAERSLKLFEYALGRDGKLALIFMKHAAARDSELWYADKSGMKLVSQLPAVPDGYDESHELQLAKRPSLRLLDDDSIVIEGALYVDGKVKERQNWCWSNGKWQPFSGSVNSEPRPAVGIPGMRENDQAPGFPAGVQWHSAEIDAVNSRGQVVFTTGLTKVRLRGAEAPDAAMWAGSSGAFRCVLTKPQKFEIAPKQARNVIGFRCLALTDDGEFIVMVRFYDGAKAYCQGRLGVPARPIKADAAGAPEDQPAGAAAPAKDRQGSPQEPAQQPQEKQPDADKPRDVGKDLDDATAKVDAAAKKAEETAKKAKNIRDRIKRVFK